MTRMLLAIPLAIVLVGCGDGDTGTDEATGSDITITAENTRFDPDAIRIQAGETIQLTLDNNDGSEHDFQVDEIDAEIVEGGAAAEDHGADDGAEHGGATTLAMHTEGNQSESVTFVANTPGTFEFYCTVPGHKDAGMVGELTVE